MKTACPTLPVIFRVYTPARLQGEVVAIFPTEPGTNSYRTCACYHHAGQHGSTDRFDVIRMSRPATEQEAAPLLRELRGIYESETLPGNPIILRLVRRISPQMDEQRMNALDACIY